MSAAPRAVRLAWLCVVAWIAIEGFFVLQIWTTQLALGSPVHILELLCGSMISALLWALFTPPLVFVTERLPLHGRRAWLHVVPLLLVLTGFVVLRGAATGYVFSALSLRKVVMYEAFARNILLAGCTMLVVNVGSAMQAAAASRERQLELEGSVARARAEALRNRLDPPAVLGALDAIAATARSNRSESERLLHELCDRIRWSTSDDPELVGVDE